MTCKNKTSLIKLNIFLYYTLFRPHVSRKKKQTKLAAQSSALSPGHINHAKNSQSLIGKASANAAQSEVIIAQDENMDWTSMERLIILYYLNLLDLISGNLFLKFL